MWKGLGVIMWNGLGQDKRSENLLSVWSGQDKFQFT